jgi:endonuclease YncB( thermonuclease family)
MPRLLVLLVLAGALVAVRPDAAAAAFSGPCLVPRTSETCTIWKGRVTYVGDGDTIYVDVAGDGTRATEHVRLTGINAMEQSVYSRTAEKRQGDCHALEATARLEQLIERSRWRVRLIAQDPASHSRSRPRRAVAVKRRGRWIDAGRRLLAEGHAMWLPNRNEWLWNRDYNLLAQRAAAKGIGLWNPGHCAPGPSELSPLQVLVNADADGADADNLNGEWVKVRNLDPVNAVPLGGWWVRDSALRRYTFPDWVTLPPGETVTVRVGEGVDSFTELFWGLRRAAFDNVSRGVRNMGDGAYLFDPEGDLRSWQLYPCRVNCVDPNVGAIEISAKARGREHVLLRNRASWPIDLTPYRLESRPFSYTFSGDSVLQPGEELRIDVEGDPAQDTRLRRFWGETGPILNNGGDTLRLATFTGIELGCYAFGDAVC